MSESENTRAGKLGSRPVGRRDLLKLGATTAVVPAVLGPASLTDKRKNTPTHGERELPAGPFSVGYWSGDADTSIMSARSLSAGDAQFAIHGARVEMIGMSADTDSASRATLQSLAIDITTTPVPFRAWRYENTAVRNVSSPSAFSVPVDARRGLSFTVEALAGRLNGTPKAGGFRLSLGKEKTVAKLQSGYYVIAIGANGRSLRVSWSSYELKGDNTGQSLFLTRNGQPVTEFPYVIFSVAPDEPTGTKFV